MNHSDMVDENRPKIKYRRLLIGSHFLIPLFIIILTCSLLFVSGKNQNGIVCDMECGEAVIAKAQADQFVQHGAQFGLIENENTFQDPKLYTHNVNIGDYLLIALEVMGIHRYDEMIVGILTVHAIGLFYIYLSILLISGSSLVALSVLAAFSSAYWGYGAFAMNPLRVWHALAFFMLVYHGVRWTQRQRLFTPDLIGVGFGAVIAFGCGYDFWVICAGLAVSLVTSQGLKSSRVRLTILRLVSLGGAFAFPFVLRQLQIIYTLGAKYWWADFVFSLAIKIPGASKLVNIPSLADVDAFYKAHHILRPPATPTNNWHEILVTARYMVEFITIPRWGLLTLLICAGFVVLALLARLHLLPNSLRPHRAVSAVAEDFLLPSVVGVAAGMALFAPFSLHVYFKHEFPLIAFLLLPARGLFAFWMISRLLMYGWRRAGWLPAAALLLIIGDAMILHVNASSNSRYLNFDFLGFVEKHKDASFLISLYPPAPAYWGMAGLNRERVQIRPSGDVTATLQDLRTAISHGSNGLPEYWIYQPNENHANFDSPRPDCRWQDWLIAGIDLFNPARFNKPALDQPWLTPASPGPGSVISFGGHLTGVLSTDHLSLLLDERLQAFGTPSYNCIYGTVVAWAKVTEAARGATTIGLILQAPGQGKVDLHDFPVDVVDRASPTPPIGPIDPGTEMSVQALIAAAPDFKVVRQSSKGLGYVIFRLPHVATASAIEGSWPETGR